MNDSPAEEQWVWVPFEVDKKFDGYRMDRFLTARLIGYSRTKVQEMLESARVLKGGRPAKAHTRVHTTDQVQVAYLRRPEAPLAADASIPILFEDDDLLVVNKPGDLLSHPTDKIVDHTVLGLLRHARPDLSKLHLLHRLDRETSGVIALAKNPNAARAWTGHMEAHEIQKEYVAVVRGALSPKEGTISLPIGREGGPIRVRMAVNAAESVEAVTVYRVDVQTPAWSVVRVFPKTGRLHQIRVHLSALGHPLLGDPLYTGQGEVYMKMVAGTCTDDDRAALGFPRVALHAAALTFRHPGTGQTLRVEAPVPADMESLFRQTTGGSRNAISDKLMAR